MTDPNINMQSRAAVLVIDNQYGLFGVSSDAMDQVGKELFLPLLEQGYDEVIIVTGHNTEAENNPIIGALQTATSKYGTVDMFNMMHTNMGAGIAGLPASIYADSLSDDQRNRLRLLYSMGCGDGSELSAETVSMVGFDTFVGHKGTSVNPLTAYPFVKQLVNGTAVNTAVESANAGVAQCLKPIAESPELPGIALEALQDVKACTEKKTGAKLCVMSAFKPLKPYLKQLGSCPDGKELMDPFKKIIGSTLDIQALKNDPILGLVDYATEEDAAGIIGEAISGVQLAVYGANIDLDDAPQKGGLVSTDGMLNHYLEKISKGQKTSANDEKVFASMFERLPCAEQLALFRDPDLSEKVFDLLGGNVLGPIMDKLAASEPDELMAFVRDVKGQQSLRGRAAFALGEIGDLNRNKELLNLDFGDDGINRRIYEITLEKLDVEDLALFLSSPQYKEFVKRNYKNADLCDIPEGILNSENGPEKMALILGSKDIPAIHLVSATDAIKLLVDELNQIRSKTDRQANDIAREAHIISMLQTIRPQLYGMFERIPEIGERWVSDMFVELNKLIKILDVFDREGLIKYLSNFKANDSDIQVQINNYLNKQ